MGSRGQKLETNLFYFFALDKEHPVDFWQNWNIFLKETYYRGKSSKTFITTPTGSYFNELRKGYSSSWAQWKKIIYDIIKQWSENVTGTNIEYFLWYKPKTEHLKS